MNSDAELYAFLIFQMNSAIVDIREQFPLLPILDTIQISKELNIKHPPRYKKMDDDKYVMTSDFNLLVKDDDGFKEIVRAIKTEDDYQDERTKEKLLLEKEYWQRRNVDWGLIIHSEKSITIGRNIYSIYNDFFWDKKMGFNDDYIRILIYNFIDFLIKYDMNIIKTKNYFEKYMEWEVGEGLNFFKYLLTHKIIKTDFTKKFNYDNMYVWL